MKQITHKPIDQHHYQIDTRSSSLSLFNMSDDIQPVLNPYAAQRREAQQREAQQEDDVVVTGWAGQDDPDLQRAIANSLRNAAAPAGPPPATRAPVELPRADHAKIAQNRAQAMERRRLSAATSAVADAASPSLGALRAQHSPGLGGASYFDCGLDEQALERAARSAEVQSTPQAKAAAARAGGGLGGGGGGGCGSAAGAGQREAQQRESQQRSGGGGGGGGRGGSSNRGKKRAAPSLRHACGCGADMSAQPANHTSCYSCYKRGGSSQKAKPSHSPRRACQEPWQEESLRHACGGAMDDDDDDDDEGEEEVVYTLDEAVEAWNMDGSSDAQAESGSWLRDAEEATGRRRGRCSFDGCPNQAEVGGHVWIRGEGCFIAPICRPCNRYDNPERMQGAGARLRANIDVTEAAITEGMRNAERRIAVGGGGGGGGRSGGGSWGAQERARRECQACGEDIADQPESHQLCRGCFGFSSQGSRGRGGSSGSSSGSSRGRRAPRHRRECQECGTDISDRPANHSVCLGCFRGGGGGGSGGGGGRHSYGSGSPGSSDSSDSYY
jgi:hypothetical protein